MDQFLENRFARVYLVGEQCMRIKNRFRDMFLSWFAARAPGFVQKRIGFFKALPFRLSSDSLVKLGFREGQANAELLEYLRSVHFILHMSDGAESLFHLDIWHAFCQTVDQDLLVVIRLRPLFNRVVKERPSINVVYVEDGRQAEWIAGSAPELKSVLYLSNAGRNADFVRLHYLRHIFLGHGDSEKAASCGRQFRIYDEVWTSGVAHIDRFRNSSLDFSSTNFRVVGRPMVRPLIEPDAPHFDNFLFLPTWEGPHQEQNYTSARLAENSLSDIVAMTGFSCVAKFHPYTGLKDRGLAGIETRLRSGHAAEANEAVVEEGTRNCEHIHVVERANSATLLMRDAAFLVADISSVVSDFLVTGRPIFLYVPKGASIRMSSSSVPMDRYCYVYSDRTELLTLVKRVIVDGHDDLRDARLAARNYFVDIERTKNHQFEAELRKLMAEKPSSAGKGSLSDAGQTAMPTRDPLVIAHRGVTTRAPENSLAAFRDATRLEALDAVEFDVHLTADGKMAIIHDAELDRTTDGKGAVGNVDLAYLEGLRLKNVRDKEQGYSDEPVPTLGQVLETLAPSKMELHIELKNDALGNSYKGLPQKVIELVRRLELIDRCVLTSFTPAVLEEVRYLDPNVRLLASVNMWTVEALGGIDKTIQRIRMIEDCTIAFDRKVLNAMRINSTHEYNLQQYGAWVVNHEDELREAFGIGYRQVTTDRPETAIGLRDEILKYDAGRVGMSQPKYG